jgi:hypothetical protein
MEDFDQDRVAAMIAAMLSESHGIVAVQEDSIVRLLELSLIVEVDEPVVQHNGSLMQIPIGVGDPDWDGLAWDQAVGVAEDTFDAVTEALMHWTHYVLPLFVALRQPDHPMTQVLYRQSATDMNGTAAEILAAPVMTRDFGGLPEGFLTAVAQSPPTMVVAEWLLAGSDLPQRPVWLYTMAGRVSGSETLEVTLNNALVTEHFPGFADGVDWGEGNGTVKSWAILRTLTG